MGTVLRREWITAVAVLALTTAPLGRAAGEEEPSPQAAARLQNIEKAMVSGRQEQERLKREAQSLSDELTTVKSGLVKAAAVAQEHEDKLTEMEGHLAGLEAKREALREALARRGKQTTRVLMALERLAWRPTEALIAQPLKPADTVRTAILLRAAVPQIKVSAHDIRGQLVVLSTLRSEIAARRDQIGTVTDTLAKEHMRLAELFSRKASLQQEAENRSQMAARHVLELAREAGDLRELMIRLEEERRKRVEAERRAAEEQRANEARRLAEESRLAEEHRKAEEARIALEHRQLLDREAVAQSKAEQQKLAEAEEQRQAESQRIQEERRKATAEAAQAAAAARASPKTGGAFVGVKQTRPFSEARGTLPLPARGRIVTSYGQVNDVGLASKGLTIRTRPGAQVIAPYDGVVVFSGNFRGYGQLLIIEHGEGYHTLLAGMTRIDTGVGQHLVAGEPVGVVDAEGDSTLYVELRREGQPINPLPWLTAQKGNNRG
ncbi:MAG: peptidoglycan DD-metalloendopeptidase family protein [Alphaproteobacteria bacterium]|nr:peptidoglycan DD-metalloendopeptidase family protein [Alphaproteobacteria bacterium]